MNDHHPHNNEQRPNETPFGYILKRALLHLPDESVDTARYRSATLQTLVKAARFSLGRSFNTLILGNYSGT